MEEINTRSIMVAFIITCLFLTSIVFAKSPSSQSNTETTQSQTTQPGKTDKTMPEQRGQGLLEAVKHVPAFVAEKLTYMHELFSSGVKDIGKGLSDWIHAFFQPVVSKRNETASA